jgi:hypothetical protein
MKNKTFLVIVGVLLIATVFTVISVRKAQQYRAAYIEAQRIREHNDAFLAKLQSEIDDAKAANIACADKLIAYDKKARTKSYRWQLDHLPTKPICVDVVPALKTLQDGARELAAKGIELK